MAVRVRWTKRAQNSFEKTIRYVEAEWRENSAMRVARRIRNVLQVLSEYSKAVKIEIEEKQIRAMVISRHNSVYYRIRNDQVIILKIIDNRQRK
jgi:plasmid stabilization system protein ParE